MSTYTPFIERNVDKIAGAIQQKQQKDLSSSAYMGDKQALEQLFGVNPALAERIQTKQAQSQQAKLSQQASRNKALHEIGKETINMEYEQAASYAQRRAREMGIEAPVMPREVHEQMKQAFGSQAKAKDTARMQEWKMLEGMKEGPKKDAFARMVGAEESIKVNGVEYKKNPLTMKYEPLLDARSDVVSDQQQALADQEADKQSRLDFGKSKTKWQTGKPTYNSKIRSARNDQKVMTDTADEIRATLDNYSAKYGTALSGISGTDANKLKGLYTTMLANSAFSTLIALKAAGGTLGAISGSELDLLKAKQGELNQAGQVDEQLRVLEQILEANERSIQNIETEFAETESMFSGSYDDFSGRSELKSMGGEAGLDTINPPKGMTDNGDGTFTLPDGRRVRAKR
jgi:hypothetical protein